MQMHSRDIVSSCRDQEGGTIHDAPGSACGPLRKAGSHRAKGSERHSNARPGPQGPGLGTPPSDGAAGTSSRKAGPPHLLPLSHRELQRQALLHPRPCSGSCPRVLGGNRDAPTAAHTAGVSITREHLGEALTGVSCCPPVPGSRWHGALPPSSPWKAGAGVPEDLRGRQPGLRSPGLPRGRRVLCQTEPPRGAPGDGVGPGGRKGSRDPTSSTQGWGTPQARSVKVQAGRDMQSPHGPKIGRAHV